MLTTEMNFVPTLDSCVGTHYQRCIGPVTYGDLVKVLGPPNSAGDEYKVSTEWILKDEKTGRIVTLYDWKETCLYSSDLPSVEEMRLTPTEYHIGAHNAGIADKFYAWLLCRLSELKRDRQVPDLCFTERYY